MSYEQGTFYNDLIAQLATVIDDYELGKLTAEIPTKENKTISITVRDDEQYFKE